MRYFPLYVILLVSLLSTGCFLAGVGVQPDDYILVSVNDTVTIQEMPGRWRSGGSGFVFLVDTEFWYIATVAHIVRGVDEVRIDGHTGTVLIADPDLDLAIVTVPKAIALDKPTFITSWAVQGATVRVLGRAWVQDKVILLEYRGIVISTDWDGEIAYSGGTFPGCSGGPLVNEYGYAIGVVSRGIIRRGSIDSNTSIAVPVGKLWGLLERGRLATSRPAA